MKHVERKRVSGIMGIRGGGIKRRKQYDKSGIKKDVRKLIEEKRLDKRISKIEQIKWLLIL